MNFRAIIVILLLCSFGQEGFSQKRRISQKKIFASGEITLKSGEKFTCEIGFPLFNGANTHALNLKKSRDNVNVHIKLENGKLEKIDQNEIHMLKAWNASGKIQLKREETFRFNNDGERKSYGFNYWLDFKEGCDQIQGYIVVERYDLTKKGEFIALYKGKVAQYALQSQGEDHPTIIGNIVLEKPTATKAYNKERKKDLEKYFEMIKSENGKNFLKDKKRVTPIELSEFISSQCN